MSASEAAPAAAPGWRVALLAWAGAWLIRGLRRTVRLHFYGDQLVRGWERAGNRYLLAFWHRHLLLMRYAYRGERMTVLVSRSRDGELVARVLARLGVDAARGSSSRGGAIGLRELLRRARAGSDLAVTPDGPRGPARQVQPGVVLAAAASGLPIVPVAIAADRAWQLRSWDRMLVPRPLSRVAVAYGEPLHVPRNAQPAEWGPRVAAALDAAEQAAERFARDEGHRR